MLSPKYYLYLAVGPGKQYRIDISPNPRVDAFFLDQSGYREMFIVQPPQPIWIAEIILSKLVTISGSMESRKFFNRTTRLINELNGTKTSSFKLIHRLIVDLKLPELDLPDLESIFWGRSLLGSDVPELIKSCGYALPWDPEDWLQYLRLQGKVKREAAINIDLMGIPVCRRCGSTSGIIESDCIFCGSNHCWTCTACQTMGLSRSCTPLYYQAFPPESLLTAVEVKPVLHYELTPPQRRASLELERFIDSGAKEFLVWAVCGAGKTEVSFQAVAKCLSQGRRVLFAIPRRDVVTELGPRFQKAFPTVDLTLIYGGSGNKFEDTPLTIATTHQCLRFFARFDLVILDEADAYPYHGSAMLHYAVKRALKPQGRLIVMTATPDEPQIKKTRSGKLPFVSIPARFHRQPLIVPELLKLTVNPAINSFQQWEPPSYVRDFLVQCKIKQRRVLLFLPTIKIIDSLGAALVKWAQNQGIRGAFSHSKCNDREALKASFAGGELDLLVTSTILERGITIPNLDVLVLFADNEAIFNQRSLIQIAGRAGRMGESAKVVFAGKSITKSMKEACRIISEMNREAKTLGYID